MQNVLVADLIIWLVDREEIAEFQFQANRRTLVDQQVKITRVVLHLV